MNMVNERFLRDAAIRWRLMGAVLLVTLFVLFMAAIAAAHSEIVSSDEDRLALFGFDPVAYYADGEARPGEEDFEILYRGLVWRFAHRANMAAFATDPEAFVPAYGGHGAVSVARGHATPGQPIYWVQFDGRLFFFYSAATRYIFLEAPGRFVMQADAAWPKVSSTLTPAR